MCTRNERNQIYGIDACFFSLSLSLSNEYTVNFPTFTQKSSELASFSMAVVFSNSLLSYLHLLQWLRNVLNVQEKTATFEYVKYV